jgi:oligoendopeptidase F
MNSTNKNDHEALSADELRTELKRLKENLQDLEETHAFTFGRTSVHIGAEQAQSMQETYEEECRAYQARIAGIEAILKRKEG